MESGLDPLPPTLINQTATYWDGFEHFTSLSLDQRTSGSGEGKGLSVETVK